MTATTWSRNGNSRICAIWLPKMVRHGPVLTLQILLKKTAGPLFLALRSAAFDPRVHPHCVWTAADETAGRFGHQALISCKLCRGHRSSAVKIPVVSWLSEPRFSPPEGAAGRHLRPRGWRTLSAVGQPLPSSAESRPESFSSF